MAYSPVYLINQYEIKEELIFKESGDKQHGS